MNGFQRSYPFHKIHLKKGKFYASVKVPQEIRHLHSEPRFRLSTGTSDKSHAERLARDKVVPEIHRRLDALFDQLDPFVEGLRDLLAREGVDVGQWYRDGKITHRVTGEQTRAWQTLGVTLVNSAGKAVVLSEVWSAHDYPSLCSLVTGLGYAVPGHLLKFLSDETRQSIDELTAPRSMSAKDAFAFVQDLPPSLEGLKDAFIEAADKEHVPVKVAGNAAVLFSDLANQYLEAKRSSDSQNVHSKRKKACQMFLKVNGDRALADYDKLHMLEMARFMDNDENGRQWAHATIKSYVSYAKQAFDFASELRGPNGKVLLQQHPMHDFKLSEYGSRSRSYAPFTTNELHELFLLELGKDSRLLLSILVTTGMRLDEAALLTSERILEHEGILSFSLVPDAEDNDGVKVKNRQSMRYVPVPDVIKPLLGNLGPGRLFSYRISAEGKSENAASKDLMRYIRQVTDDPRKVVHSLRGNLKDLLRDAGVSKEINDFITGHAQGDVAGGRYGSGPSMAVRKETLDSIKHPWLQQSLG